MTPAEPLLDHRQRKFALRALKLPQSNPANQILPQTLKYGDGNAQPEDYPEADLEWIYTHKKPANLAQRLARKLTDNLDLDPSEGFEQALLVKKLAFPGKICISSTEMAIKEAEFSYNGLTMWSDGSRLDSGATGAGIAWKTSIQWQEKSLALGYCKEIYDAELFGILEALKIAIKERRKYGYTAITIFSDSQSAILRASNDELGPGQVLAINIIKTAKQLTDEGVNVTMRWVPSHINIEGNERADVLAKKAANKQKNSRIDGYSSFSHINRLIKREKLENTRQWLLKKQEKRQVHLNHRFELKKNSSLKTNKEIFQVKKQLSSRFFQLKIGHAITAKYLKRIGKSEFFNCWWCSNRNQSIEHLLLECRQWRKQRLKFYKDLENAKVSKPRTEDKEAKFKLFNNPHAFKAILAYISGTKIGTKPDWEERERENERNLDSLDLESYSSNSENEEEEEEEENTY